MRALPTGSFRVLDLGCGNGALAGRMAALGHTVTGLDFTPSGIERARVDHPEATFFVHDLNDPLPETLRGRFDVVVATEVIEHLFLPRNVFFRCAEALAGRGPIVVTTPYHGFWKNLAVVLAQKSDAHWNPLADYGHIKFFSKKTLAQMAEECGFRPLTITGAGRLPFLSATMVMTAERRD